VLVGVGFPNLACSGRMGEELDRDRVYVVICRKLGECVRMVVGGVHRPLR